MFRGFYFRQECSFQIVGFSQLRLTGPGTLFLPDALIDLWRITHRHIRKHINTYKHIVHPTTIILLMMRICYVFDSLPWSTHTVDIHCTMTWRLTRLSLSSDKNATQWCRFSASRIHYSIGLLVYFHFKYHTESGWFQLTYSIDWIE